ncbi:hypothetical protein HCCG_02091 [Helicobacter cinaedi CCUG 18818 = ATCC BAA-847]|uniref:Uncharacterized protein n=1 Tax=Helicobacter cinaedi CCUG 18818 = ATCC BAA-847 TaxID=537971 RepID=A0ABN0BD11_9HELI|nr:hypothetical protein [Helicobacter cinaedi]EFR47543.1 hypothetical protein HCCG_02091 [Helicobacter cinaedi CCUG 18818 = ATCC BAA-847]BBB20210.1 hypothetical protein HC081234_13870 [Helicobacter cinaedi]
MDYLYRWGYNKGGLIDDARVFVGFNYKYFDMRVGILLIRAKNLKMIDMLESHSKVELL